MKLKICFFLFVVFCGSIVSQDKKSILKPYKLGFMYNYGSEDNFLFNDKDYTYTTNTFKAQAFYKLKNSKSFNFELIVQPQVQFLHHQLLNEWYVTPDQENYQEKIAEFTQPKNMNLYGIEFALTAKTKVYRKLNFLAGISLGFSYIDTRTERLAKGFTFIENFSFGFSHPIFNKSFLYVGSNFGHVSNLNFKKPNDGYNILGVEVGYSFLLN